MTRPNIPGSLYLRKAEILKYHVAQVLQKECIGI